MIWSRTQDRGLISVAQLVMVATSDMALQQSQMHREWGLHAHGGNCIKGGGPKVPAYRYAGTSLIGGNLTTCSEVACWGERTKATNILPVIMNSPSVNLTAQI